MAVLDTITNILGGSITEGVAKIIGLFKIDPTIALQKQTELAEIQLKMQSDAAAQIAAQLQGQLDINKAEASSQNIFVAGWRPFIGWVCGSAFAYAFVVQPLLIAIAVSINPTFNKALLPSVDMSSMMPVLLGMLGLGTMRTFEKVNGVNSGH